MPNFKHLSKPIDFIETAHTLKAWHMFKYLAEWGLWLYPSPLQSVGALPLILMSVGSMNKWRWWKNKTGYALSRERTTELEHFMDKDFFQGSL